MHRIEGLDKFIQSKEYREALDLPEALVESYSLLAQGEYNINYLFTHPLTREKLLLRVNCGSQMHLEHQIEYEASALGILESSGRTPRVLYVDGSKKYLNHGVLVMEFLPGKALDYEKDMAIAAEILADIHSVWVPEENKLLTSENPLRAILEECEEMFSVYLASELGDEEKKIFITNMMEKAWEKIGGKAQTTEATGLLKTPYRCCINTELNSTNFLINKGDEGKSYLIDWEKPLFGDPAQDLGHFLAPTTTFWKTDVILTVPQMHNFVDQYLEKVAGRFPTDGLKERTDTFIQITCLRGITWCAMAWVQYQDPDKLIFNESTFHKLEAYLDMGFLKDIDAFISD